MNILIIGDAPTSSGEFLSASDRCLQKAMRIAGLEWAEVERTYISKQVIAGKGEFRKKFYETIEEPIYTPKGNLSKRKAKTTLWTAEMQECVDKLAEECQRHNPNLIVAAGHEAFSAITGISGITNYRGSIVESRGAFTRTDGHSFKVLATLQPSYIVSGDISEFFLLAHDLKKAKREAEFSEIQRVPYEERIPPYSIEDALWMLSLLRDNPSWKWTLDVETRAGTLACFAIGYWNGFNYCGFCIPIQLTTGPYWKSEDECAIWEALHAAASANPNFCNQNIEYDIYYLLRYGIEPSGVYMDTMLAHSLLYPEFPKGLDFLCSFYLDDVVYYKGEGRNWSAGDRDEELWKYNVKDAVFTLRVVEQLDKQLKERGLYEFYHGKT